MDIETQAGASLRIPLPLVVEQTYHRAWTERLRKRVRIWCGGHYRNRTVTFYKYHPAHVRSEMVNRPPLVKSVGETLTVTSSVNADAPFESFSFPEPETSVGEQTPVTQEEAQGLRGILDRLNWPW